MKHKIKIGKKKGITLFEILRVGFATPAPLILEALRQKQNISLHSRKVKSLWIRYLNIHLIINLEIKRLTRWRSQMFFLTWGFEVCFYERGVCYCYSHLDRSRCYAFVCICCGICWAKSFCSLICEEQNVNPWGEQHEAPFFSDIRTTAAAILV